MRYPFTDIESRWQQYWDEHETFRVSLDRSKPKYYVLDMFPYPSGAGLHVGHPEGYTATDIVTRYKRMRGFNVLHPMGWDAFGLPAEQYAIKEGIHPAITTQKNVDNFRRQLKMIGFAYDWSREVNTTDPRYVRWTQWIFSQLYKQNLAYLAEVAVNWCPELGTVLANEEVPEQVEKGYTVLRKPMRQWMLRITAYAERLLRDLDELDWPESLKEMQRNWIGRSEGAEVDFRLDGHDGVVRVFTTRPDTLWGATYMVLAPEHPLVDSIVPVASRQAVRSYVDAAARKSELERTELAKDKTGVFTGAYAINPMNGARIPIWVADYVLISYGTGAIMAVPAHDARDWDFAKKFGLPIVEVVSGGNVQEAAFTDTEMGVAVNSDFINGLGYRDAFEKVTSWLEEQDLGKRTINYKLRDWLFSRQRYWGEPFPILHLEDGTHKLVPEHLLPVLLPEVKTYKPSGTGESPLATIEEWVNTVDPETGKPARRETNTMPQWAGSCWYYLRFMDPGNDTAFVDAEAEKYWGPVDLYVGGTEHAVLHLLYARFWHKVLFDLGHVHTKEPFLRLVNQGMILGEDGRKMSKSFGNVINPDDAALRDVHGTARAGEALEHQRRGRRAPLPQPRVAPLREGRSRSPDGAARLVHRGRRTRRGRPAPPAQIHQESGRGYRGTALQHGHLADDDFRERDEQARAPSPRRAAALRADPGALRAASGRGTLASARQGALRCQRGLARVRGALHGGGRSGSGAAGQRQGARQDPHAQGRLRRRSRGPRALQRPRRRASGGQDDREGDCRAGSVGEYRRQIARNFGFLIFDFGSPSRGS